MITLARFYGKSIEKICFSCNVVAIFIFGNKWSESGTILANGMRSEYEIAKERHCLIVPVGCTGFMAQEIWKEVKENLSVFYTNVDDTLIAAFEKLNCKSVDEELTKNIISFINLFKGGKYSPV